MSEKASIPTPHTLPPPSTRQPFIPKADKWTTKLWHTYIKIRPAFQDDLRKRIYRCITDDLLIAVHMLDANPEFTSHPEIKPHLDLIFAWEDSPAESRGEVIITDNPNSPTERKLKEAQEKAVGAAKRVMYEEGGGERYLDQYIRTLFCLSPDDTFVDSKNPGVLQQLYIETDKDVEETFKTRHWENYMQGLSVVHTLSHEIAVAGIWMDHIEGAINSGLLKLDQNVLYPNGNGKEEEGNIVNMDHERLVENLDTVRADFIDWKRIQWERWETVESKGLSELEKKRAFRRWRGDSKRVFYEEFPVWRRARMGRVESGPCEH